MNTKWVITLVVLSEAVASITLVVLGLLNSIT